MSIARTTFTAKNKERENGAIKKARLSSCYMIYIFEYRLCNVRIIIITVEFSLTARVV